MNERLEPVLTLEEWEADGVSGLGPDEEIRLTADRSGAPMLSGILLSVAWEDPPKHVLVEHPGTVAKFIGLANAAVGVAEGVQLDWEMIDSIRATARCAREAAQRFHGRSQASVLEDVRRTELVADLLASFLPPRK
jgi:hypothetical protein